jgi:hypothetical protein
VSTLKRLYQDSYDKNSIDTKISQKIGLNKQTLNFDEFFDIMASEVLEKKKRF